MFEKDWTMSLEFSNHFIFNIEHIWENLYIQLRNQQTCISDNHNPKIRKFNVQSDF